MNFLLAAFIFTITADSHLDENTRRELYERTLKAAAADKPVFHVDLGDTFMSEKQKDEQQYADQRRYFDLLKVPVHLVTGNHDGECGRYLDGTTNNLAMWSRTMRLKYFPGQEKNYYSWERDNALFVVLDPYWFTPKQRHDDDNWVRTLGKEQYDWLKRTLETSKATFKFVFIHQLVGGLDRAGRGGVEVANLFEWGGKKFNEKRPGWPMPIHSLLVSNRVSIVYQEVQQPGDPRGSTRSATDYGYKSGIILASSGYLRVTVSPNEAKVEYVRLDKSVAHSYVLPVK